MNIDVEEVLRARSEPPLDHHIVTNLNRYAQYDPSRVNLLTVMIKSLLLGIFFTINIIIMIINTRMIYFRINVYFLALCVFHSLEFISTVLFNNSQVDDDSFILEDSDMYIVIILSLFEYSSMQYFFPVIHSSYITFILGLIIAFGGQYIRWLAMYTAQESFNHYIQRKESHRQVLVTRGIYSIVRHPSYGGFFWWFVGLQLMLGNYIVLMGGMIKLWSFFKQRIQFEEVYLIKFYKLNYINYKDRVIRSGIPFV
ncbi:Isoprenylcysteine carboxyl methyltransferase family-domain-containing protein [Scheffersomyces coipomensis]|uniref:Isoprenylcysteine carboxyl methyltransferase family-domain-containing protein n=1 Tax=Scheffersomyces coipomensis TaxID=1788519 RepID=UPI00315D374A